MAGRWLKFADKMADSFAEKVTGMPAERVADWTAAERVA